MGLVQTFSWVGNASPFLKEYCLAGQVGVDGDAADIEFEGVVALVGVPGQGGAADADYQQRRDASPLRDSSQ